MVGTATHYALDGSGWKVGGNKIFLTHPNRPRGPPSHLYNGYRVCPLGKEGEAWSNHPSLSRPRSLTCTSIHTSAYSLDLSVMHRASLYTYLTVQWQLKKNPLTFLDHWPVKWQLCKSALTNTSDRSFSGSEHGKPYRTQETDNRECCGQDMNMLAQRKSSPIPCGTFYRVITVIGITHCICSCSTFIRSLTHSLTHSFIHSFIHSTDSPKTSPQPLPKRFLHRVRCSASPFNFITM